MTRLKSRAWNWKAMRPPGSFDTAACSVTVQFPESAHELSGSCPGRGIDIGFVELGDVVLGETAALPVAGVRLRRLHIPPVGGHFQTLRVDHHQILVEVVRSGVEQQLLDHHLGRRVFALAEVVIPNLAVDYPRGRPPASS